MFNGMDKEALYLSYFKTAAFRVSSSCLLMVFSLVKSCDRVFIDGHS